MGLSYWDFIYNPRSDSWEVVSNQAFSTKEVADDYLKQNQKTPEDIEMIANMKRVDDLLVETNIENLEVFIVESHELQKEIQQLKEQVAERGQIIGQLHTAKEKIEQDSKTNADKIRKLKDMLERFDIDREHGNIPNDWNEFIDKLAKIVWNNSQSILKE